MIPALLSWAALLFAQAEATKPAAPPPCPLSSAGVTALSAADLLRVNSIHRGDLEKIKKVLAGCLVTEMAAAELKSRGMEEVVKAIAKHPGGSSSHLEFNEPNLDLMLRVFPQSSILEAIDDVGDISADWYVKLKSYDKEVAEKVIAEGDSVTNPKDLLVYERFSPNGELAIGCASTETMKCVESMDLPLTSVEFTESYWISRTEVTEGAWKRIMERLPSADSKMPKTDVTWEQAMAYCKAIGGTLPTEAQWTYAATLQVTFYTRLSMGDDAWFGDNSGNNKVDSLQIHADAKSPAEAEKKLKANGARKHEVGTRAPNAKLFDMVGNVAEYTSTKWQSPPGKEIAVADDNASVSHVVKGASYLDWLASPFLRTLQTPHKKSESIGFRCIWFPIQDLAK